MRIGIKVGSSVLLQKYEKSPILNLHLLCRLCQQIATLVRHNKVFLVTSGAVASDPNTRRSDNLRAAVGQCRLMSRYSEYLSVFGYDAAQFLLIDDDLKRNRDHLKQLFTEAFQQGVVPIINANDVINSDELNQLSSCADNDNLFGELCLLLKADMAIIAIDGPSGIIDDDGKVYWVIDERNWSEVLDNLKGKSEFGYGLYGAKTKIQVCRRLNEAGILTIVAPAGNWANDYSFVERAVSELLDPRGKFGTTFKFSLSLPVITPAES